MIKETMVLSLENKYKDCSFILTGSYKTGNMKPNSDIDIIVLSPDVAISHNEKFYIEEINKYIDCLVIPKNRITEELEKSYASKSGALIRMIAKGEPLSGEDDSLTSVFETCDFLYHKGKEYDIDEHDIKNKCIKISNAIDDLEDCENSIDKFTLFSKLFDEVSQLYCIANNRWESNGKARLAELKIIAPDFVKDFDYVINELFSEEVASSEIIEILKKHLNVFHNFQNQYSTRKAFLGNQRMTIEILDASIADYKGIINLITYYFNKKFKLYIKAFSFEYKDTQAKSLLNIELYDDKSGISNVEIFNGIKADILHPLTSYITQNVSFKGTFGGEALNGKFDHFKERFSYVLTQYLRKNNLDYKKEDVFGTGFLLSLYVYKLINNDLKKKFSNYVYQDLLPLSFDVRALKSYEELIFEKEKVTNHFKLKYESNQSNFNNFINAFLSDDTIQTEEILDSSSLLAELKADLKTIVSDIENNEKDYFKFEYDILNLDSVEDAKHLISYRKLLESVFNILGIPSIDRAFIFYILNNYHHASGTE
ncbi:hypothetical protein BBI01_18505 [Chryseobacterium artocarpi]|uniref:Polymerase nucleotidyl transferase domain-containing protein n=1 Tax=Chryseobacterium artocarpi TaxID=1414727 RepID=A0A1B8ZA29_9FLAO|nr:nucleotidyltransferase domain-containing protein [Chryseobacterium artocarpi]OCA68436.1 hypothetical protein BBI01_18505 [Chryseobacterium artocarpi]